MSFNILPFDPEEIINNVNALPSFNNTLQFIETFKNFPSPSLKDIDHQDNLLENHIEKV